MTTTTTQGGVLADMALAMRVVADLGEQHIAHVSVSGHTRNVSIHPTNPSDGVRFATKLGLDPEQQHDTFQTWQGTYEGVKFTVYGSVWSFTVTSDSEPLDHPGFPAGRSFRTEAEAVEFARAVWGLNDWGQAGGNEYRYRNAQGRTGSVYTNEVAR